MKKATITLVSKQADGYKVELNGEIVTFFKGAKKGKSIHLTNLKPFATLDPSTQSFIKSKMSDTSGLWYASSGICRLRDVDGACEKAQALIREINAETAKQNHARKIEADQRLNAAKTEAEAASGGPVKLVAIRYFDGYPTTLKVDGVEVDLMVNLEHVIHAGDRAWLPLEIANKAITDAGEKDAAAKAKATAAKEEKLAQRNALIAAAAATGEKQVLHRYTSTECLDNLPDCSFDNVTIWIDAQGRETQTHTHCF